MKDKKFILIIGLFLIGSIIFIFKNKDNLMSSRRQSEINLNRQNEAPDSVENNISSASFFISGWLPYWEKDKGAVSLSGNLNLFDEINPFAFEVDANGNILDTAKINNAPWPELRKSAEKKNVKIIPTILWGDAKAMHKVLANSAFRNQHIENITELLQKNNFPGADIDYEGKDIADRDNFSAFIQTLQQKLNQSRKSLNCTVEARTEDAPPAGFTGTRAMSFANDFSALNDYCDSVRVMAYDEVFQIHRTNVFTDTNKNPSVPNADNQWAEEVINYSLKFIKPEKLILGVPTYGWEFKFEKLSNGYRYTRVKSVSYPEAMSIAKYNGIAPMREGGELTFIYKTAGENHIITFSDAQSIKEKIGLAKKLDLKGISLFKLDGLFDPQLFSVLEEEK